MSIGQLVASEVVIVLIMAAVEKLIMTIDTFYEMVSSVEKISQVMDFPLESETDSATEVLPLGEKLNIQLRNVSFRFPNSSENILRNINGEIKEGDRICITGESGSGKTTFLKLLSGLLSPTEGYVLYNGYSLNDIDPAALRSMIGDNFNLEEVFEGTLLENISMGKEFETEELMRILHDCKLHHWYSGLEQGLQTICLPEGRGLPGSIKRKIILARSLLTKPKMLILDDFNLNFPKHEKLEILRNLLSPDRPYIVVTVSNDPDTLSLCRQRWHFSDGTITPKP